MSEGEGIRRVRLIRNARRRGSEDADGENGYQIGDTRCSGGR